MQVISTEVSVFVFALNNEKRSKRKTIGVVGKKNEDSYDMG